MKVITQRQVIQGVIKRWKAQYPRLEEGGTFCKMTPYLNLHKLDLDTCSKEDVDVAIGNESWTRMKCDECQGEVDWLIQVGEEPDYESHTAMLCKTCLQNALQLLGIP